MRYAICDPASGSIRWMIDSPERNAALVAGPGQIAVPAPAWAQDTTHRWTGTAFEALPSPVMTLEKAKEQKWTEIKQRRAAGEFSPLLWDGSEFDADSQSQRRIQGAVQLALLSMQAGSPYSLDWTLSDDSVRTMSGTDMVALGIALGTHVATQHAIARGLRTQIIDATTIEAVEAITWPT